MKIGNNLQVLRKRLVDIMDSKFSQIYKESREYKQNEYAINEAKLQDWTDLIQQIIIARPIAQKALFAQKQNKQSRLITIQRPLKNSNNTSTLLKLSQQQIQIFMIQTQLKQSIISKALFQKKLIKSHCSCTVISEYSAIFIGGSRTNPNLKSNQIYQFLIKNKQVYQIGRLPYGISSHGSIYVNNWIYIIGGNKDHGIVSRGCFRFQPKSKTIQQISCLSYPTASMGLTSWKDLFIYKFGGIGESFGEWGLSPYIERYSLSGDIWETINPEISQNCKTQFDSYNLMAHCFAYVTQSQKIVVFGGFDFQGRPTNTGFVMKIQQNQQRQLQQFQNSQNLNQLKQQRHIIQNIGAIQNLPKGGFFQTNYIYDNTSNKLYIVEAKLDKQNKLHQQFIKIQPS